MLKTYVLTQKRLRQFLTRYGEARCRVCGESFEVGDVVLSKSLNKKAKQIHERCRPINW